MTFIVSSDWFYECRYYCLFIGSICLENIFLSFDPSTVFVHLFVFSARGVFCKQYVVESYSLTQFAILCLLIRRAFTFSVNTESCLFPFIFISLLFSFIYSLFSGLLAQNNLFFLESSCLYFLLLYVKFL
jgi:hypothetical protein